MKTRIFVIDSNDVTSEICNKKVTFRKTDRIYIFVHSEDETVLTDTMKEVMDGKEALIQESDILRFFRERNTGTESMYFVGETMGKFFHENIDDIMLICAGAAAHNSFGVGRVKLSYLKQQSGADYMLDAIAESIGGNPSEEQETDSKPASERKPDTTPEPKPEQKAEQKQESKPKPEPKPEPKAEPKAEPKVKQEPEPKPEPEVKQESKPEEEPTETPEEEDKYDFSRILEEIKPNAEQEKSIDEEVNDQKAMLMAKLRERLNQHISEYIKQKMDTSEYFKFMTLVLKCDTHEEFNQSWKTQEPTIPVKLVDMQFQQIRFESAYYYKLSSVLFAEDRWADERKTGV